MADGHHERYRASTPGLCAWRRAAILLVALTCGPVAAQESWHVVRLDDPASFQKLDENARPLGGGRFLARLASSTTGLRAQPLDASLRLHPALKGGRIPAWTRADQNNVPLYVLWIDDRNAAGIINALGGQLLSPVSAIKASVVLIPADQLDNLADHEAVLWIEPPLPAFQSVNDGNRLITEVESVQTDYGLDGSGVSVMVYDGGGAEEGHPDFGGRLTDRDDALVLDHATHVSGTIGGSGLASGGNFRGMAPGVTLESYGFQVDFDGVTLPFLADPGDIEADYDEAINLYQTVIANNSIGINLCPNDFDCAIAGDYGVAAQLIDAIVTGALGQPMRIVWSAGNGRDCPRCIDEGVYHPQGYRSIAPPACAKNTIVVGAVQSHDEAMTSFSAWGPTDDGRIKPDLVAPGCQIGQDFGVTSTITGGGYIAFCGTSMAAPTVTGASALLIEDHRNRFPQKPDPSNAAIKALLLHTAGDLGPRGPDYRHGFGALRIRRAIDQMDDYLNDQLDHNERLIYPILVESGTDRIQVTCAWDDAPAAAGAPITLVNDLDLRLFDPNGTEYFPWTLDPADPAAPARQDRGDHRNNVEQVVVDQPAPGLWLASLHGYAVPLGPQPFALAVTPSLTGDCDGNGLADADEIASDPNLDCTGNGVLDRCEPDCNGNGQADSCEVGEDCDGDERPDSCAPDCDGDSVPDSCDLTIDCNANTVPDECEADCNGNTIADECDIGSGTSEDCNKDGIPDECQQTSDDCDGDGTWDACQTATDPSLDQNGNGIPDSCEPSDRTIHVAPCADSGDGSATDPFCTIQEGIDASISGNEVVVAPGTYSGAGNINLDFGGRLITLRSSDPSDESVVAQTVIDCRGAGRGLYFNSGETREATVDGLTIRGGIATLGSTPNDYRGGGIHCADSSPTIRRCVIEDCATGPTFFGRFGGGGIHCLRSSPLIDRCVLRRNTTFNHGAAIYCFDNSHAEIVGCRVLDNRSEFAGGGISASGLSNVTIRNTLVAGNHAPIRGGGISISNGIAAIRNCTITRNTTDFNAAALYLAFSNANVDNCIVWQNSENAIGEVELRGETTATFSYNDFTHGQASIQAEDLAQMNWQHGNISADPGFVGAMSRAGTGNGNEYLLSPESRCVNAGNPKFSAESTESDVNGDPRVLQCRVDIGADESPYFNDCNANATSDACDVTNGLAIDDNHNLVPDECEMCAESTECDDGEFCNGLEECVNGLCVPGAEPCVETLCDEDRNTCVFCLADSDCTADASCAMQQCVDGACISTPIPDCQAVMAIKAVAINDEPLAEGGSHFIQAAPGDTITCEIFIGDWQPHAINIFQFTVATSSLANAPRGHLAPVTQPAPASGAFIDQSRDDWFFSGLPTITAVSTSRPNYVYGSATVSGSAIDRDLPAYAGTLRLAISGDAVGTFEVGFIESQSSSFLDPVGSATIDSIQFVPLHITVPTRGCEPGKDCNNNGVWDACDLALGFNEDCNNNQSPDECDIAELLSDDCNNNGMPDECEFDCDNNGRPDSCDLIQGGAGDCNNDQFLDRCEDCNGNGLADECDLTSIPDCNTNFVPDDCDIASGHSGDCNSNLSPDECDVRLPGIRDCNFNLIPDNCELLDGTVDDCNANSIPDSCEDCNENGSADECDIADGVSADCNGNGVPDECEDCNDNGIGDSCEIASGLSGDCNDNDLPDDCEDCNLNGVADECDIDDRTSADANFDGIPDECDLCELFPCDNQQFCDGQESCMNGVCSAGQRPCGSSPCLESEDRCVECLRDNDCADHNPCTDDRCVDYVCRPLFNTKPCDDGNRCTAADQCVLGACSGAESAHCDPRVSLKAIAVNGVPLSSGPSSLITIDPGDEITSGLFLHGWAPDTLRKYSISVDSTGYTSGVAGELSFSRIPANAAFIDLDDPLFVFAGKAVTSFVDTTSPSVGFESESAFEAAIANGDLAYAGTLILRASSDAAGAFRMTIDASETALLNADRNLIRPIATEPLTIAIQEPGCEPVVDCNENGLLDSCDVAMQASLDCNANGRPDECDVIDASSDCTNNGIPDECEPNCNGNLAADSCDIKNGISDDCNHNGIPDECEDCDGNGKADQCDIAADPSLDCNQNSQLDRCEVALNSDSDCTHNGIPDECESDCNNNGSADSCDIAFGTSVDIEENGIPDECQNTHYVPESFPTIQEAINAAATGDVVMIADGVYTGAGNNDLSLGGKVITVRSANGPEHCTIVAADEDIACFNLIGNEPRQAQIAGLTLSGGRGIVCNRSSPTILKCRIVDNPGGGLRLLDGSKPRIQTCVIASNAAPVGGGVYCSGSNPLIQQCTVIGNSATFFGGGIFAYESKPRIHGSIVWENTALAGAQVSLRSNSNIAVRYSNIDTSALSIEVINSAFEWDEGNISVDPLFVDGMNGSHLLSDRSRCINAGDPLFTPFGSLGDIQGDARISHAIVDIGADEATVFADCNQNGVVDWKDLMSDDDCNQNNLIDACEDCDSNGLADECDLAMGLGGDCNHNLILDSCENAVFNLIESSPGSGTVDARQATTPSGSAGWQFIEVLFTTNLISLSPDDLTVSDETPDDAPQVRLVTHLGQGRFVIRLSKPLEPYQWTTILHDCSNEQIRLGFFPGDVSGDGTTNPEDVAFWLSRLESNLLLPLHSLDIDRSESTTAADLLRMIDILSELQQ